MSSHSDYDDALDAERAVNEDYLRRLKEDRGKAAKKVATVGLAANVIWGGAGPTVAAKRSGALIGRVALGCGEPDLRDFYVAPAHVESDDVLVVSWAAPLAGLLFDGRDWDPRRVPDSRTAPDPETLLGRRTFAASGNDVVGLVDDLESGTDQHSVFRRGTEAPTIPAPPSTPSAPQSPAPARATPPMEPPPPTAVAPPPVDDPDPRGEREAAEIGDVSSRSEHDPAPASQSSTELRRAGRLVMDEIDKPRGARLHSVLRTLQPDQHRVVKWSEAEHLAVQGHPGTGKTIVATHRAAFLTHAENPDRLKRVGLIGPTDEWKSHVHGVLDETGAEEVQVISIETLIRELAGGSTQPLHRENEREFQTNWAIVRAAERAVADLDERLWSVSSAEKKMSMVMRRLVEACSSRSPLVDGLSPECRDWVRAARSLEHARTDASYLLLRAGIGMAVAPPSEKRLYQNLIVDEVQDLRPAEWRIIDTLRRIDGRWSLFGDMNQRRADVTWASWDSLLTHLEVGPADGSVLKPESLSTGYRSNDAILRYAGWLLPRRERRHRTLRSGSRGTVEVVRRFTPQQLIESVEAEARALTEEYDDGLTAVIVWSQDHADRMRQHFLESGWRRPPRTGSRTTFALPAGPTSGGEPIYTGHLRIIRAVQARGLEFDGVVVVEPADFQMNVGRNGSLYTSLTRADKKLVVVHSRPLPKELKGRVRPDPARR